nr:protein NOI4 isoform X2 [Ziziphus jujuba var. spinosa]
MEKGRPLPKFGEWDVNDPASAEGFTVIFNKARDEKKTGGKPESPGKGETNIKPGVEPSKPQSVKKMVLLHSRSTCRILTKFYRYKCFHGRPCCSITGSTIFFHRR